MNEAIVKEKALSVSASVRRRREIVAFFVLSETHDASTVAKMEGSSVSVVARRERARHARRIRGVRSSLVATGSVPILASETGNREEAVSRAVFPARSPGEHGAATTEGVRVPPENRVRRRPLGRTFGDDVETRVEVASGACRERGEWASNAHREIFRYWLAPTLPFKSRFTGIYKFVRLRAHVGKFF